MRTPRPILLASAAAALLVAAACSRDAATPASPTILGAASLSPFYTAGTDTTSTDSVVAGYGCSPTGGLDYQCFEYEPCTGTEYVVCPDTTTDDPSPAPTATASGTASTDSTSGGSTGGTSGGSTGGTTTPEDSVQSGYGSGSTGGIEYDPLR